MTDIPPEVKRYIDSALRRANAKERRVVRAAIRETLLTLGVDASTPAAVQELQRDFSVLRRFRLLSEARGPKVAIIVFTTVMTLLGAVVAMIIENTFWSP